MNFRPLLLLGCCLAFVAGVYVRGADAAADNPALRVIILANSADSESVALARYYAEKRGVPADNIIALRLPTDEMIAREEFDTLLYQPLQDELVRRQWIEGTPYPVAAGAKPVPRRKYAITGHHLSYLVVCRGVPLLIRHEPSLPDDSPRLTAANAALAVNSAAVDAELALLPRTGWPLTGFVTNPLFRNDRPASIIAQQVVKVARLDGPTPADARGLVDTALAAEATGLVGRGYIDIGGPHAEGNKWLEEAAKELDALGFDHDVDREPRTLPPEARFDAPALYFGWYDSMVSGPFTRAGFRFPPGAVALHIYSGSATNMRDGHNTWTPGLVARGVAGTVGNVTEPYLQFTHEPQLLLHALARGDTLGDAAAYAIPYYSWMGILVGDPLYRPFKVTFEEQWRERAKLSSELRPYVVMRRMRLLEAGGKHAEAVATGREAQAGGFNLAVALTLADLQRVAGDKVGAARSLAPCLATEKIVTPADAPLLATAARQFEALGEKKSALQAWQRLLASASVPHDWRVAWLKPAAIAARAAADTDRAVLWEFELKELTAGQPESKK
jgi:uncharacterized protein (TIGR03790 family)